MLSLCIGCSINRHGMLGKGKEELNEGAGHSKSGTFVVWLPADWLDQAELINDPSSVAFHRLQRPCTCQ